MKRIEVVWDDIISWGGWHSPDHGKQFADSEDSAHTSIGYLVDNGTNYLTICQSYSLHESVNSQGEYLKIPKSAVREIRQLQSRWHLGEVAT